MAMAHYSIAGDDSESQGEVNLIQRLPESRCTQLFEDRVKILIMPKKKSRRYAHQFFFNSFMGIFVFLLFLALVGITIGLYAAIDEKS